MDTTAENQARLEALEKVLESLVTDGKAVIEALATVVLAYKAADDEPSPAKSAALFDQATHLMRALFATGKGGKS